MTNRQTLSLEEARVTDEGLVYLKGLTSREILSLGTPITNTRLAHPAGLTKLKFSDLLRQVTDAGLVHRMGLTNLQSFSLNGIPITDAGAAKL